MGADAVSCCSYQGQTITAAQDCVPAHSDGPWQHTSQPGQVHKDKSDELKPSSLCKICCAEAECAGRKGAKINYNTV
jgi:hypothetical protein